MSTNEQHWVRKHMSDIAWVAKRCQETRRQLTAEQHRVFGKAESMAHALATGERMCSHENTCAAVSTLCLACRMGMPDMFVAQCSGRTAWDVPCDLILREHQGE